MHTTQYGVTTFHHNGDPAGSCVEINVLTHAKEWPQRYRGRKDAYTYVFNDPTDVVQVPDVGLITAAECGKYPHLLSPLGRRVVDQSICIPFDDLLAFVANYVRSSRISVLEAATPAQILGLKP